MDEGEYTWDYVDVLIVWPKITNVKTFKQPSQIMFEDMLTRGKRHLLIKGTYFVIRINMVFSHAEWNVTLFSLFRYLNIVHALSHSDYNFWNKHFTKLHYLCLVWFASIREIWNKRSRRTWVNKLTYHQHSEVGSQRRNYRLQTMLTTSCTDSRTWQLLSTM